MEDFRIKFQIEQLKIKKIGSWVISLRPKQVTIGSLILSLDRKCSHLGEITEEEGKELSLAFAEIEDVLNRTFSPDKINYLALMMVDHQVHFHVIPRYENPMEFNGKIYKDNAWPGPANVLDIIEEDGIEKDVLHYFQKELERKTVIGYTTGVYDLFHIGHLNILKKAKENCDYLIVGVTTDDLVSYKNTSAVIPFEERLKIVEGIKYVDRVVPQEDMDKMAAWNELHFDKMFVGSDWEGTNKWNKYEKEFAKIGVEIQYFSYTKGTSSTHLKRILSQLIKK